MWDVRACRACLNTSGKLERINEGLKRVYTAVTGLEIVPGDGYPNYFCQECRTHIKRSLQFRRKSLRANYVLKEIMIAKKQVTLKEIQQVNRKKNNLESPYSNKITNNNIYDIKVEEKSENDGSEEKENVSQTAAENTALDTDTAGVKPAQNILNNNVVQNNTVNDLKDQPITKLADIKINYKQYSGNISKDKKNIEINLAKEEPKTVVMLTDIKPDNWEEIEREEERIRQEQRQAEIDKCVQEIHDDDNRDNDVENYNNNDEIPEDIDLDDVFKGLKEPSETETDSDWMEWITRRVETKKVKKTYVTSKIKKEKKKKMEEEKKICSGRVRTMCKVLAKNHVRYLTQQEQKVMQEMRLRAPKFVIALFKCALCIVPFNSMEELLLHVKQHSDEGKNEFMCHICKRRFATELLLNKHCDAFHWYEYQCNVCGKKYSLSEDLRACHKSHEETGVNMPEENVTRRPLCHDAMYRTMDKYTGLTLNALKCENCNIGFQKPDMLAKHLSQHIPSSNTYECDICHLHFRSLKTLGKHMQYWHRYSYTCNFCDEVLMNRQQVKYHMISNICAQNPEAPIICKYCGKKYSRSFIYIHTQAKHFIHKPHCCIVCGKCFESEKDFYKHQLLYHEYVKINHPELGDPQFLCAKCDHYFLDQPAFDAHLTERHAEDAQVTCEMCMKVFPCEEQRAIHYCPKLAQYPKPCKLCDVLLASNIDKNRHMKDVHQDIYMKHTWSTKVLCELCGKSIFKSWFKRHMAYHSREEAKMISCQYCTMKFLSYTSAVCHMLGVHVVRPFVCAVCKCRFKHRGECREHILKVHSPELLYYCSICNRRFAHLDFLNAHCVKMHNLNVKQDRSVFLSKRMAGKVSVYPHMKIDCTLINKEYVEKSEIIICDYMDENDKILENYEDYVIFDSNYYNISENKKKKSNKRRVRVRRKKEIQDSEIIKEIGVFYRNVKKEEPNDEEPNVGYEETVIDHEETTIGEENEETSQDYNIDEEARTIEEALAHLDGPAEDQDKPNIEGQESMEVDYEEQKFPIIIMDGEQYVQIGDVLYKIEKSEP